MTTPVRPGDVLAGKYQVEKVIGTGGMGVVVSAKHLQLGERVAIKFLLPHAAALPEVVQRFVREGRAAVRIRSEHVARVLDVGTLESGSPYLVMEFLDGRDLGAVLRATGALPIPDAIEYVLQACEALAEAHSLGIIHRDLKPGNLFLSQRADGSPMVKVIDFGISRVVHPEGEGDGEATKTAVTMGSPQYMAPEQMASARTADARSDVWSLGVILHSLISGRPPFPGSSVMEVYDRILQGAPPLRTVQPDVPAALEAAVLRCLYKDPASRFPNIAELAQAIAEFAPEHARISAVRVGRTLGLMAGRGAPSGSGTGHPLVAVGPTGPTAPSVATGQSATGGSWGHTRPPTQRSSRTPLILAMAALMVGGLAAGGLFFVRGKTAAPTTASPEPLPTTQTSALLVAPAPPEPQPSAASSASSASSAGVAPAVVSAPVSAAPLAPPPRGRLAAPPVAPKAPAEARPPKDLFNDPR